MFNNFQGFDMKKTLIALAAVAATGASFAQASLSGEFAWGYLSSTDGAGKKTSGGGIDTAQLAFKANEDLGGGMSVAVSMKVNLGDFGAGAKSDDQSLTLTTPIGGFSLLTYKPSDWVSQASGAATWYGLDGKVLSARATRDAIAYTVPLMDGLTVTAAMLEPGGSLGEGTGNGGSIGQSIYNFGAKYTLGAAVLQTAYLSYTNTDKADASTESVMRFGGTYDLGVAKVGAGYQNAKLLNNGGDNVQYAISASAPVGGNMSVNGVYASNKVGSADARTGFMLGAQYNLSKRTYAIANYGNWTGSTTTNISAFTLNGATGAIAQDKTLAVTKTDGSDSNMFAITLVHDF